MKKHVLLGLALILCCLIGGGSYLALSINKTAEKLEKVISFHRVEFLRDKLIQNVETVQSDIISNQSVQYADTDRSKHHLETLKTSAKICFTCHHSDETIKLLDELHENVEEYLTLAGSSIEFQTDGKDSARAKMDAFSQGEKLMSMITSISLTSANTVSARIDVIHADMHAINNFLIGGIILIAIAIILTTSFFLRRFTGSVDILAKASESLGSGNLGYRISHPLKDEFGHLAEAFNSMAESLNNDFIARLQSDDELLQAKQMNLIGQMAGGLAHEIKNPLAGIKVSLDVLSDELELETDDREVFALIINDINRVERVLKSLLHYARPSLPQLELIDINLLLDNSIKNANATVSKDPGKTILFKKDFNLDQQQVEVDSSQLQQVFLNIYINAIDTMKDGGSITTSTSAVEGGNIQIVISDNGPGIPATSIEKIFDPFFTTKRKGTGLGLSICKRLVELHGGTIKADSRLGVGSSFAIIIPRLQKYREQHK